MTPLTANTTTATLTCQHHGPYPGQKVTIASREIASPCPTCKEAESQQQAEAEKARRAAERNRRIRNLVVASELPRRFAGRTFQNYRAECQEQARIKTIIQRFAVNFEDVLREGAGLVLCGKPGTGKTHLSAAMANHVMREHGRRVRFMTVLDLLRSVKGTMARDSDSTETQVINRMLAPDLLILDEVGVQYGTDYERMVITDLLNKRYNEMRPTVLISNLDSDELARYVGERVMSRMTEGGGAILSFDWDSYRERVIADKDLPRAKVHGVNWSDPADPE